MINHVADLEKRFKEKVKSLRFFDANCWIGRPNFPGPCYPNGVDEIVEHLGHCGIGKAIVSHTLARFSHPTVGNSMLLESLSAAQADSRTAGSPGAELIPSFVLLPGVTGELGPLDAYIDSMVEAGGRTVRLFPKSHNYSLRDWGCADLLSRLEERKLPLFIWPRETDWDTLFEAASRHPRLPVVLEQCEEEAYWNLRFLVPLLERCENVRVETNKAHLYLGVDEIVRRFGASRVLFGSNLPVDDPFASLMLVADGDFSDGDKEKIARGNLENLIQGVNT